MITIRPRGVYGTGYCYPCGDMGGRSPGVQGLRGIRRGALGALALLGDGPTAEEVAMEATGTTNADASATMSSPSVQARWAEAYGRIGTVGTIVGLTIMAAGAGLAGYHGYKRSGGKAGSTIGWAFLGGLVPIITVPVALAQGFGKRRG